MNFTDLLPLQNQHTRTKAAVDAQSVLLREPRLLVPGMQPVGLVRVDRSHPLAKGLVHAQIFSRGARPIAPCPSRSETFNGDAAVSGGKLRLDGTGDYLIHSAFSDSEVGASASMLFVGTCTNNGVITSLMANIATWTGWYIQGASASSGFTAVTTRTNSFDGSVTLANVTQPAAVALSGSTTRFQAAANGKLGTADTSFTAQSGVDVYRLSIGSTAKSSPDNNGAGTCEALFIWGRALTDAELVSITSDPYSIIVPA